MTVGVGVIGLGFMGATHVRAYNGAHRAGFANRLVAVADGDGSRLSGFAGGAGNLGGSSEDRLFDPSEISVSIDPRAVIEHPDVELVSICTPTDTHVALAMEAIARGKHVLVEKLVATSLAEVEHLAKAASSAGVICMPAMCMRFWPGWGWLKRAVAERAYGGVRSAVFTRLGTRPGWSGFYGDETRSGGALFDLHVHDADFVRYLFGMPDEVVSTGTRAHVTTMYRYGRDEGPAHVVGEGGWDQSEGFGFRMRYTVVFDEATADFDLSRTPSLILSRDGKQETVAIEADETGYDGEVRAMIDAVARGGSAPVDLSDAVGVTRLLECEAESLDRGVAVRIGDGGP